MEGKIFTNTNDLKFEVVELERKDRSSRKFYKIRFIDSGFEMSNVRVDTIKKGSVRDKLQRTICNVGMTGYANTREDIKKYKLWVNMIRRCYDKLDKSYKFYGEKGVKVCDRWKRYDFFLDDIERIVGWDKELFYSGKIFIDKDINSINKKIYSLETCEFVTQQANQSQRTEEYNSREENLKIVVFPDGHEEEIKNLSQFCKDNNLHRQNANACLSKKQKSTKGFKFYWKNK